MHGPSLPDGSATLALALRTLASELRHRIAQLDALGVLPGRIRRFLVDERVPGPSVTLVPEVTGRDFVRLLEVPTPRGLEYWIGKGERSVWPAVAALRVRCVVEMELEGTYQVARRGKPGREGVRERREEGAGAGEGVRQRSRSTGGEGGGV